MVVHLVHQAAGLLAALARRLDGGVERFNPRLDVGPPGRVGRIVPAHIAADQDLALGGGLLQPGEDAHLIPVAIPIDLEDGRAQGGLGFGEQIDGRLDHVGCRVRLVDQIADQCR